MNKYKFNLNKYMYVKLTEFGKQKIIEKCGEDYYRVCIEGAKQSDGYYRLQGHEVFRQFGPYMKLALRADEQLPFATDVYFTDEDLEPMEDETNESK